MKNLLIEVLERLVLDFVLIVLRKNYVVAFKTKWKRIVNIQKYFGYDQGSNDRAQEQGRN
jgi:hypothetical protein